MLCTLLAMTIALLPVWFSLLALYVVLRPPARRAPSPWWFLRND